MNGPVGQREHEARAELNDGEVEHLRHLMLHRPDPEFSLQIDLRPGACPDCWEIARKLDLIDATGRVKP